MKMIYPAFSKHLFYFRMHISKFVIENRGVPLNPFMIWEYFLLDSVPRDTVRQGNNTIVKRADEIWVFGPIADGVLAEIKLAKSLNKPLRYFSVVHSKDIVEIDKSQIVFESGVTCSLSEL